MFPTNPDSMNPEPQGTSPVVPELASSARASEAPSGARGGPTTPSMPGVGNPGAPPRHRGRFGCLGWSALLFCLAIIGFETMYIMFEGISLASNDADQGIQEKHVSHSHRANNKIALITVDGVIMEGDGFVKKQIDRVKKDKNVKAVVLRVNSPGGTVTGSDFIHHHLVRLRDENKIPIVVSMGSMAASGGYYVAMAVGDRENSIYAEPTTTTGSIGVIIPHYDITELMEKYGIKNDSIASHPRKQMLSMTRELSPENRKIIEEYLHETFLRFKDIVRQGRPALAEDDVRLSELATGEIFTATQAHRHGLVDSIGFVEDAIDRAIELAKLDKEDVQVVRFAEPMSFFNLVSSQSRGNWNHKSLLEFTTPRAYYLMTTMPSLLAIPAH